MGSGQADCELHETREFINDEFAGISSDGWAASRTENKTHAKSRADLRRLWKYSSKRILLMIMAKI